MAGYQKVGRVCVCVYLSDYPHRGRTLPLFCYYTLVPWCSAALPACVLLLGFAAGCVGGEDLVMTLLGADNDGGLLLC